MEQRIYPVDVISVCSTAGEIRPLRLQIEDETHQLLRVDIEAVLGVREIDRVGIESQVFLCRGRTGRRRCMFELKYSIRNHTWWLIRRIF